MELKDIDMKLIKTNPRQPRQSFDREKLEELAKSIDEAGLLEPIVLRPVDEQMELVAGERRFKAFQILKKKNIPSIIRNDLKDDIDALEKSFIENLQRDDLTSSERENAVNELWQSGRYKTRKQLADKIGVSESRISENLAAIDIRKKIKISDKISTRSIVDTSGLSDLPRKKILDAVEQGDIESSKVRDIVRKVKEFPEEEQQLEIIDDFKEVSETVDKWTEKVLKDKKGIAEGKMNPYIGSKEDTDFEERRLKDFYDVKEKMFGIRAETINKFVREENKKEAIKIIKVIIEYYRKQLELLGELEVLDIGEKETSSYKDEEQSY